jgi:serine acetyltransferase
MPLHKLGERAPKIARDAYVAPGAHVIGQVEIGPGAT